MSFRIYNSLSRKKEIFRPISPPSVKMYCCGPTVYDLLHIGNFRGAVFFNFLRKWLEHKGYKITYVYNFTDVDDKILNRAKKEKTSMKKIADKYICEFKKDFKALKLTEHEHNPQATRFIPDMIQLIETLLQKNKAYTVDQDVFYAVKNFADYGKLSQRTENAGEQQSRVEVDERKKDPRDFALWKSCPKNEPGWKAPWGYGRPGWHLECTTMIFSLLGHNIDIHGGGTDLIFPHHENELAQAEGARPGPFVKYWVHNNMFTFGGEKMAKSTGNVSIMRDFLEQYNGEIFKYLVLSSHYRSAAEVSETKILQCIQTLCRVYSFLKTANSVCFSEKLNKTKSQSLFTRRQDFLQKIESAEKHIEASINDDLNTPAGLAILFTLIRQFNEKLKSESEDIILYARRIKKIIIHYGKMMSLFQEEPEKFLKNTDDIFLKKNNISKKEVNRLVEERTKARQKKDFKKADEIRNKLKAMNIEVKDSPSGTTWETDKAAFLLPQDN